MMEAAERWATSIDGGLGIAAVAAIAATPPGPRRELEIAHWVERARAVEKVATLITPGMSDDELDAVDAFHAALAALRKAA